MAVFALMGQPAAAQNTPKGKVSISLLRLAQSGARGSAQRTTVDSPFQASNAV